MATKNEKVVIHARIFVNNPCKCECRMGDIDVNLYTWNAYLCSHIFPELSHEVIYQSLNESENDVNVLYI